MPWAAGVNKDTALAVGGISVTDVDGNLSTVQLGVTNGTVTVNLAGGATISSGARSEERRVGKGSRAEMKTNLARMYYKGKLNYEEPEALTVTSRDSNAVTDVDTVAITVKTVYDVPLNLESRRVLFHADTALAVGGISVTDVDGNLSTVQLGVTNGTVTVNLAEGATISSGA